MDPFKQALKTRKKKKSVWFLGGVIANLPAHIRNSLPAMYIATVLPPNSGKRLQPTLDILVDEILYGYYVGNTVRDANRKRNVLLRSKLGYVIADLRALHKVETVLQSPSPDGCVACEHAGAKYPGLDKTLYPNAYRDLPDDDTFMREACAELNRRPSKMPPTLLPLPAVLSFLVFWSIFNLPLCPFPDLCR